MQIMGTHYYIYAEIKVNDQWYNLNPIIKKNDGTLTVRPIYDAGSSFFDICNDLECHRTDIGIPDNMSPELRAKFHKNLDEKCEYLFPDASWRHYYEQSVFCVKYDSAVGTRVIKDKPYKFEGYVSKRAIADFEVHETEEINYWLSPEEFEALPAREKKQYSFYQWNEPYDEYFDYRTIHERLCAMLYWFGFGDAFENRAELWHSKFELADVRLFIERC